MSKGSNTTTTSSSPNPAALSQYYQILDRANNVSQKPYQAYGGEYTAPINGQQQAGFGAINDVFGQQQQFTGQGAQSIQSGFAPITGADISQYYSPYQKNVIDATQADFDTQNARQQSQVTGNAAAQGALGGNRVGVAQALTAEAQNRTQAPIMAQLENQGFQNAYGMAANDRNRAITGGQALSGIGSAGLGAANAMVGAGTLQQQTQQSEDTARMQEYLRSQGYDFQTAQWLAGISTGVGSQMGGTSQTEGPQPNQWAQLAGLGLSAAAMFRDGGAVHGFAGGGTPGVSDGVIGWVPSIGLTAGHGAPAPPPSSQKPGAGAMNTQGAAKGLAGLGDKARQWFQSSDAPSLDQMAVNQSVNAQPPTTNWVDPAGDPDIWPKPPEGGWYRGGRVRRGFAEGGVPMSTGFGGSILPDDEVIDMTDAPPIRTYAPDSAEDRQADMRAMGLAAKDPGNGPGVIASNMALMRGEPGSRETPEGGVADKAGPIFDEVMPGEDSGVGAMAYAPKRRNTIPTAPSGFAPRGANSIMVPGSAAPPDEPPGERGLIGKILGKDLSDEARQGLISMGLSMMTNQRGGPGSFLGAVGQGGQQGLATTASAQQATQNLLDTRQKQAFEEKKLEQARTLEEMKLKAAEAARTTITPYQQAQLDRENLTPVGTNDEGFPVYLDKRSGREVVGTTKLQGKSPAGYLRNPDGTMAPIKGGPADPEVITGLQKAKSGAQIPDATADFLAERVLAGDGKALVGMGRGAQGAENIIRIQSIVAQKAAERGLNASDILAKIAEQSGLTAQQRTFGNQIAKMAVNSTEAEGAIHQGLEVSKQVPRGKFVPINKLVQMAEANISDPDLLEFRAANLAIINTYARAISPTGTPTVHDKEEAMKVVSEATSPEAYERVMQRMLKEIAIAHAAPAQAKKELERIRKSSASTSDAALPPAASTAATPATIPPAADRETGKVYQTPKGPARWMGGGWQKVD